MGETKNLLVRNELTNEFMELIKEISTVSKRNNIYACYFQTSELFGEEELSLQTSVRDFISLTSKNNLTFDFKTHSSTFYTFVNTFREGKLILKYFALISKDEFFEYTDVIANCDNVKSKIERIARRLINFNNENFISPFSCKIDLNEFIGKFSELDVNHLQWFISQVNSELNRISNDEMHIYLDQLSLTSSGEKLISGLLVSGLLEGK